MAGQYIFYPPPPTPQRAPTVPIPAQGQQPPNKGPLDKKNYALIVSLWPTGMEPGLPRELLRTAGILRQPRVDQPPISDPTKISEEAYFNIVGQWPTTYLLPAELKRDAAITNQPRVSQPPISDPTKIPEELYFNIVGQWTQSVPVQQQKPGVAAVAPPPPVVTFVPYARLQSQVIQAWQAPDPFPQQRLPGQVVSVDQPPPYSAFLGDFPAIADQPMPVQARPSAVTASQPRADQPPVVDPTIIPQETYFNINRQWPTGLDPGLPRELLRTANVTSQPRVDQPPVADPTKLVQETYFNIVGQWTVYFPTPQAEPSAATIPAPIAPTFVPFARLPQQIIAAWSPADPMPQRPRTAPIPAQGDRPPIADPTPIPQETYFGILGQWAAPPHPQQRRLGQIVSVDQPPPHSITGMMQIVLASSPTDQRVPQAIHGAATIPAPSFVPFSRLPAHVLAAWMPQEQPQQRRATLPIPAQGDQPPVAGPISRAALSSIVSQWQIGQPMQGIALHPSFTFSGGPVSSFIVVASTRSNLNFT